LHPQFNRGDTKSGEVTQRLLCGFLCVLSPSAVKHSGTWDKPGRKQLNNPAF